MYQAFNQVVAGQHFWNSLSDLVGPIHVNSGMTGVIASVVSPESGIKLVVAKAADGFDRRIDVVLHDEKQDRRLIDVRLSEDLEFHQGKVMGVRADEMALADLIWLYKPDLLIGNLVHHQLEELGADDE